MGQVANFCGQGMAPFQHSLAGALLSKVPRVITRASTFTLINGNVLCIYDKRLQNLYIV